MAAGKPIVISIFLLVPKLLLGNAALEVPASRKTASWGLGSSKSIKSDLPLIYVKMLISRLGASLFMARKPRGAKKFADVRQLT
jgi:hypothetical protein